MNSGLGNSSAAFRASRHDRAGDAASVPAGGIAERVSQVYEQSPLAVRARLIERLLRPVGPLALLAVSAGAFAHLIYRLGRDAVPVSLEDAARISSEHVLELARYIEQSSPAALAQMGVV
jgi:hypothetical protein